MSDDLIRRRDAIDALKPIAELLSYGLQSDIASDIASALMSIPTIEPKRGEWISNSPFTGTCSECGADGNLKDNFCSNCGADMRKEIYNDSRNNI